MMSQAAALHTYPVRDVLNTPISAIPLAKIDRVVASLVEQAGKKTFFYVNAHCLNIAAKDSQYKKILQHASLVYSGGLGPVLASRIVGQGLPERTPTPDFIDKVFATAQKKGWSIYLLGTKEKSLVKAVSRIKEKFPRINIVGYHHGYFSKEEEGKVIEDIHAKQPTIVIVGMGTPRQEKFMAENIYRINAQAFWAVGALFDVISGELPRAPVWMQSLGLEWLFRLFQEPQRLWRRYIIGNTIFIVRVLLSLLPPSRTFHKLSLRWS